MADEFDPFVLETGLITNYTGKVVDSWFTKDPKYNNGQSLIMRWKMETDQEGENAEWTEGWPVGSEWTTMDGGKTAVHPKGDGKTFNASSQFGKVIAEMVKLGAIGALKELGRRDPRNAEMWKGTTWKFEQKQVQTNQATGEPVMRNVPVQFLGVDVSVGTNSSSAGATTAPVSPTPTASGAVSASNGVTNGSAIDPILAGLSPAIQAAIKLAAKTKGHSEWVDAVLTMTGVADDLNIVTVLDDEAGLYSRLRA